MLGTNAFMIYGAMNVPGEKSEKCRKNVEELHIYTAILLFLTSNVNYIFYTRHNKAQIQLVQCMFYFLLVRGIHKP